MKKQFYLIVALLIAVLVLGCNSGSKPDNFDYGKVENNKYSNSFFGFNVEFPSDWVIQSKKQTEQIMNLGKEMFSGDNKKLKAIIKASEIKTAYLLTVFKYEVGAKVVYNPNIMLVAENVSDWPGIKKGSDYLFHARKLLLQSNLEYDHIDESYEQKMISGKEFYEMNTIMKMGGMDIKQTFYSTIKNGFNLGIIISYIEDEQKNELDNIINTIKFN